MVIVGVGNDLVHIPRIARVLKRFNERFLQRVLHESEIQVYHSRAKGNEARGIEYLASRWAIKEASYKVLSGQTGVRVQFPDIVSSHLESGLRHSHSGRNPN